MVTVQTTQVSEAIGDCAGDIWRYLSDHGPANITRLLRDMGVSRDLVFQGIGWLAREDKIVISEDGRKKIVSLNSRSHA